MKPCSGCASITEGSRTNNWLIRSAVVSTPSNESYIEKVSSFSRELSTLPLMRRAQRCGAGLVYAANAQSPDLRINTSARRVGEKNMKIRDLSSGY
jgi:hypothetical protein